MLALRLLLKKILAKPADLVKVENMDYVGLERTMQNKGKVGFALRVSCGKQLNANVMQLCPVGQLKEQNFNNK